jgi:quercetin dioxygenase-like cupin family protein
MHNVTNRFPKYYKDATKLGNTKASLQQFRKRTAIISHLPKLPEVNRGKEMVHSEKQTGSEKLAGKVVRLADLVDYQDGAVVSREIINKKTGTVTLFAFDKGQGLSEHTAPFDALVYILDGEADITISGKTLRLKEGEMVIMPANQPHALKAVGKFKMILTMIRS